MKRYRVALLLFLINFILLFTSPQLGRLSFFSVRENLLEMLKIIPPIFILMGLMDMWVEKEVIVKHMGVDSGLKGIFLSFFMGAFSAGPLYAAFPIAALLLKKGTKISNVLIFIGVWSTTKIPLLLFEISSLGIDFAILRFILNLPVIIIIAFLIEKVIGEEERKKLYERVGEL